MTRSLSTYQPSVMPADEELLLEFDARPRGSLRLVFIHAEFWTRLQQTWGGASAK